jgi:sulfate transport system permease protein
VADATAAVARPRTFRLVPRAYAALGPGVSVLYLTLLVVLPVAALVSKSATGNFWTQITAPQASSALKLTVSMALIATVIDIVTGIALAWVLVRDEFPGKSLVNAIIDLPFALPTIVAGLVLLTLYGPGSPIGINVAQTRVAVLLALLFVTLPFVVRTVQPVLTALDRDVEDAAACLGAGPFTTFRRVTLPSIMPATLTGAGLAFARALGEFGSIVLISGNLPFKTQVSSVIISSQVESGAPSAAAAVSVELIVIALVVLALLSIAARRLAVRNG